MLWVTHGCHNTPGKLHLGEFCAVVWEICIAKLWLDCWRLIIASYLYQRKQRVKIGNIRSSWNETNKSVPQGSILGPLIFNIFMNDLFYFVKRANLFNYADDDSVSVNGKELSIVSRLLQSEAEVTVRWFCDNAMEANPSKFQGISFKGNKQVSDFKVSVDGHDMKFSNSMTSLGICIDDTLTFDSHISDLCLKASRQISALQRLTGLLDYPSRKAIYSSFISSHFNYCPLVWFFTSRASITKMQKNSGTSSSFCFKRLGFWLRIFVIQKRRWFH